MNRPFFEKLPAIVFVMVFATPIITFAQRSPGGGNSGGNNNETAYRIIALDSDTDGAVFLDGEARDLNEWSEVVGQVQDSLTSDLFAAFWTQDNQLSILPGNGIGAVGINDYSETVGYGFSEGLYWQTPVSDPVVLPGRADEMSTPRGINNDGIICGASRRAIYGPDPNNPGSNIIIRWESVAVVWKTTTNGIVGPFVLPSLFDLGLTNDLDESFSVAACVSNANPDGKSTIAGTFLRAEETALIDIASVKWTIHFQPNSHGQLEPLIETEVLAIDAIGTAANVHGDVSGIQIIDPREDDQAVVWSSGSTIQLPHPTNVTHVSTTDISDAGIVVGSGWFEDRRTQGHRALVWQGMGSEAILLDKFLPRRSPLIYLQTADAVNGRGEIVGRAAGGAYMAIPE